MLMGNSLIEPTTRYCHIFYIGHMHAQELIRYIDCRELMEIERCVSTSHPCP